MKKSLLDTSRELLISRHKEGILLIKPDKIGITQNYLSLSVTNLLNTSYREYLNRFRYYADEMGRNITLRIKIPFEISLNKNKKYE